MESEYRSRVNRVVDFIEANLDREFTLAELADRACFSKFHFNRVFRAVTGETLFGFIQRIRVERAAAMLVNTPDTPVTRIALDCGFNSSSAFARCFKAHFNLSATQWREQQACIYQSVPDKTEPGLGFTRDTTRVLPEELRLERWEPERLAYVRYTGPYEGNSDLFARLYRQLSAWAGPRDLLLPDTRSLVLYHDSIDITDADKLRISACITVPPGTRGTGQVGIMDFAPGKYACFRFRLTPHQYYTAWQWVFADWLPESGYQPGDGPCFEYYPKTCTGSGDKMAVDICVPVVPL